MLNAGSLHSPNRSFPIDARKEFTQVETQLQFLGNNMVRNKALIASPGLVYFGVPSSGFPDANESAPAKRKKVSLGPRPYTINLPII